MTLHSLKGVPRSDQKENKDLRLVQMLCRWGLEELHRGVFLLLVRVGRSLSNEVLDNRGGQTQMQSFHQTVRDLQHIQVNSPEGSSRTLDNSLGLSSSGEDKETSQEQALWEIRISGHHPTVAGTSKATGVATKGEHRQEIKRTSRDIRKMTISHAICLGPREGHQ